MKSHGKMLLLLKLLTLVALEVSAFVPIVPSSQVSLSSKACSSSAARRRPRRHESKLDLSFGTAMHQATSVLTPSLIASKILPVGAGIFALTNYHVQLQRTESSQSKNNATSWRSAQAETRVEWAQHVRETKGWLYAIQTLRNAITANTFLATTVLSLLTVITGKLWDTTLKEGGKLYPRMQFTALAVSLLRSAYEFLQSARLMTHAGFMFPVCKDKAVDDIMRKASVAQWLGLRWLYIGGTVMVWTIGGEVSFFLASLVMVRFFRAIDQAPES
jgi:hypothetical protein